MTTNNSSISAIARMFRNLPVETVKAIEDVEDQFDVGGESAISSKEALTGASEGMRGGNASPMIRRHSDLDAQRGRQAEYDAFAGLMADIAKATKANTDAIAALTAPKIAAKAVDTDASYLTIVEKSLKIAAREIFKAETDEDDEDDSKSDKIEKAERHLAKAAKLLAKAESEEDEDDNESKFEKARTDIRKLTKALKPFREAIKAEAVAKAEADAAVAKAAEEAAAALVAVKAEDKKEETDEKKEETAKSALETSVNTLQEQFGVVTKSVAEVMEMVAGMSRGAKQPNFVAKSAEGAKVVETVDFATRAEEAADCGRISDVELMQCHNLLSRMAFVKSGQSGSMDIASLKSEITAASSGVREVFAPLFAV